MNITEKIEMYLNEENSHPYNIIEWGDQLPRNIKKIEAKLNDYLEDLDLPGEIVSKGEEVSDRRVGMGYETSFAVTMWKVPSWMRNSEVQKHRKSMMKIAMKYKK